MTDYPGGLNVITRVIMIRGAQESETDSRQCDDRRGMRERKIFEDTALLTLEIGKGGRDPKDKEKPRKQILP